MTRRMLLPVLAAFLCVMVLVVPIAAADEVWPNPSFDALHVYANDARHFPCEGAACTDHPVKKKIERVTVKHTIQKTKTITQKSADITEPSPKKTAPAPSYYVFDDTDLKAGDETAIALAAQRQSDLLLKEMGLQTRFDVLRLSPTLGLSVFPAVPKAGEPFHVLPYSNYLYFIKDAQLVVEDEAGKELQRVAMALNEANNVSLPVGEYNLYLEVQDEKQRSDRTELRALSVREDGALLQKETPREQYDFSKNHLQQQRIPLYGGTVTVTGKKIDNVSSVRVLGNAMPLTPDGSFAVEQILPAGVHDVTIDIAQVSGQTMHITRQVEIPNNSWFFLGIADLTVGKNNVTGPAELVTQNAEFDEDVFFNGRLGMFTQGKIKGRYLLTAAFNTDEEDVEDIFRNLDEKDPRQLLRRIDPEKYYPVYGDDSEITEEAPTQGKFYVRLENETSHVMWGNFKTQMQDTEFAKIERGLYGANLNYNSHSTTSFGTPHVQIDGFVAEPGTLAVREDHRGTGGSLYYLQHQDITVGSETVRIEVRDENTGVVLETRTLRIYEDYDMNYVQGRIMLHQPLASVASDNTLVQSGSLSGHPVYLVSYYEYTPTFTEFDAFSTGGRASVWIGDHVQVGMTGQNDNSEGAEQELLGGDATIRLADGVYVKGEYAQTDGQSFSHNGSSNGGYNFAATSQQPIGDDTARAWRGEMGVNFQSFSAIDAQVGGYYESIEAGFSGAGQFSLYNTEKTGANAALTLGAVTANGEYSERDEEGGVLRRTINGDITAALGQAYISAGIEHDVQGGANLTQSGQRTDAAIKLGMRDKEKHYHGYVFGQQTFESDDTRLDNDRYGIGGDIKWGKHITLGGEISDGDSGVGAKLSGAYTDSNSNELYVSYQLTGDSSYLAPASGFAQPVRGQEGTLTFGGRKRYSDSLSVYGEERAVHEAAEIRDLVHAYGIDYTPQDWLTIGTSFEQGTIEMDSDQEMERLAGSITLSYGKDTLSGTSHFEAREEENSSETRTTYLTRNDVSLQMNEALRGLGKFNLARSNSSNGDFFDGDFIEASIGLAYRPIDNDKLNLLARYTYLYDLPAAQQVAASGVLADYKQKSHLGSFDITYDLNKWFSLGAKYGIKYGEITTDRASDTFFSSLAHLGVLRADMHVVKKWDALAELRYLTVREAEDSRLGALGALYYHLNDHIKFGAGYNFAEFDDDLTNLDYDAEGPFINILSRF